jgi:hypothetical protein
MKKTILTIVIAGLVVFGLIQLVPIDRSKPATIKEPNWASPEARALVKEHCFQCHSYETEWPWYSYIAPASWLINYDVVKGRHEMNFSDWDNYHQGLDQMSEKILNGRMPPIQYTIFHPGSTMDAAQKQALIDALKATLK